MSEPFDSGPTIGEVGTILIAEDEPLVRDIAVRVLSRAGYDTLTAKNGQDALEIFRQNAEHIVLLISDVIMPKLNGHEAYMRMMAIKPSLKVLFCSGYDPETANSERLVEQGLRLMQKPFAPRELLRAVRELLPAPSHLAELVAN